MRKPLIALLTATGLLFTATSVPQSALAQRVVDVNPSLDSQDVPPDTSISGLFDTRDEPGVREGSVKIFVNDRDVTGSSTITENFFSYRPEQPLPPGPAQVRVEYVNTEGQRKVASWEFTIQQPQAAFEISSVTHNAAGEPLGPGATFLATLNGTPGAEASVLLVENDQTVRALPAQEVSAGVYIATLNVQSDDQVDEGVVVGRLQRQDQVIYAAATQPIMLSTSAASSEAPQVEAEAADDQQETAAEETPVPLKPELTSHQDGGTITTNGFTLVGQTQPGASVDVEVTATRPGLNLGGIVSIGTGSETLVDRTVQAGENGRFQIQVPASSSSTPGMRYTVRMAATKGDDTSAPLEIGLTQK